MTSWGKKIKRYCGPMLKMSFFFIFFKDMSVTNVFSGTTLPTQVHIEPKCFVALPIEDFCSTSGVSGVFTIADVSSTEQFFVKIFMNSMQTHGHAYYKICFGSNCIYSCSSAVVCLLIQSTLLGSSIKPIAVHLPPSFL